MSTTWFRGGVKKHFLGHRKLQRDRRSAAMLPWLRQEYVLTHEEGLSLSDDDALALVRICLTPRSRRGNLEQGIKQCWSRKSCHIGRRSQFWQEGRRQLGWRRGQCGAQIPKLNLYRRSMSLSRFCIFFKRTLMKILRLGFLWRMKGKLGRKWRRLSLEKMRLYIQSMAKGDLEVKRAEPKSNQSALHVAAMTTPLQRQSQQWWWRRTVEDFKSHWKERIRVAKPKWLWYHVNVWLIHRTI